MAIHLFPVLDTVTQDSPTAEFIASLEQLIGAEPEPPPAQLRSRRPRDAGMAMLGFALVALAFESEALLSWARRLEPSAPQGVLLSAAEGVHRVSDFLRLTRARQVLSTLSESVGTLAKTKDTAAWGDVTEVTSSEVVDEPAEVLPLTAAVAPPLDEPVVGKSTQALASALLVGDSLIAGSLALSLSNGLGRRGDLRVVRAVQIGTGISAPEVFDWPSAVAELMAKEAPQLVIVSLGANDARAMRVGDEVVPFGAAQWKRVYSARVVALMRALTMGGARVLWIGLPAMRDAAYSRRADVLNQLVAEAADNVARAEFLDVSMLVGAEHRRFATFLPRGDGRLVRVRLDDGVHYAPAGSALVARWVVDWVKERFPNPLRGD